MKKYLFVILGSLVPFFKATGQVTTMAPGGYVNINIVPSSGDYSRCVILLHEMYNGVLLGPNHVIGELAALRGNIYAFNRVNVAQLNTASVYNETTANVTSLYNNVGPWKFKTCTYNGKKYLALDIPYSAAHHSQGYKFTGWAMSTAECMIPVTYELNGAPVNQHLISDIQDFDVNQTETHEVKAFNVMGNMGIGTLEPKERLSVNGNIRAREIKVETKDWPDYVFNRSYDLPKLSDTKEFIEKHGHLPEIPSAAEVHENGIELGKMDARLLKKIEELTLHLLNQQELNESQEQRIKKLESMIADQKKLKLSSTQQKPL